MDDDPNWLYYLIASSLGVLSVIVLLVAFSRLFSRNQ